jgi:hypothetical protein
MNIGEMIYNETKKFISEYEEESLADRLFNKRYSQVPTTTKSITDSSMGELIGYIYKDNFKNLKEPVAVYKNPKSLKNFGSDTRGILTNNIDLYIAVSYEALHNFILDLLVRNNILTSNSIINYMEELPEEFIAIRRASNTNTLGQGRYRNTSGDYLTKFPKYYSLIFDQANSKFPFNFNLYTDISEIIDPNNMISNIPNQHLDGMPNYDPGILY